MVSPIFSPVTPPFKKQPPLQTGRLLQAVLSIVKRGSSLECLISTGRTCQDEAIHLKWGENYHGYIWQFRFNH
jgi:hypothetical protein